MIVAIGDVEAGIDPGKRRQYEIVIVETQRE
jgi:hypothetical protein